jgi:hypothetical protein
MENSRLSQVLRTFSQAEFKRFGEFVNSPFFNKSNTLITFYNILKNYYPDFDNTAGKIYIFEKVYPGERFNDEKMRNLKSELLKLAEKYLAYINFEKDPFDAKKYLLMELSNRELENIFHSNIIQTNTVINNIQVKDEIYYLKQYVVKKILRTSYGDKIPGGKTDVYISELKDEMENFVRYFAIKMLKYYCMITNEEQRVNVKLEKYMFDEVISSLKKRMDEFKDVPAVQIFYNLLLLNLNKEEENHFNNLQRILIKNPGFENTNDFKHAHLQVHHFCRLRCTGMESEFSPKCFGFMKSLIDEGKYPLETKYISDHTFICLATAAIKNNQFDWTNNFIHNYKRKLSPTNRENAYKYAAAILDFHKGHFNHSIKLLLNVSFKDFYYYIRTRSYLLKNYYEVKSFDKVYPMVEAFKKYLVRDNDITEYDKIRFNNFLRFVKLLCLIKDGRTKMHIDKLNKDLESCENIENKEWLSDKIQELY